MENLVTNAVIVKHNNKEYLFGEVVQDDRYPQGHHILSTEIISKDFDDDNYKITTKSGTKYQINKLFKIEEFKQWAAEQADKVYWGNILNLIGLN